MSTQKRQKQYFEQRKQRQQQQMFELTENSRDGLSTSNQHQNNNRSLDILSFLNVPEVAKECKYNSPEEVDASPENFCKTKSVPAIIADKVSPGSSLEASGSKPPSSQQVETMPLERVPLGTWNSGNHIPKARDNKAKYWKNAPLHSINSTSEVLSVFDLIGDNGASDNSEGTPVSETHVGFSIEGLGKLGTDTPVRSPQRPCRTFPGAQSSLAKPHRHHSSFKNFSLLGHDLEIKVEKTLQGYGVPFDGDFLGSGCQGRGSFMPFSCRKSELLSVEGQVEFDGKNYKKTMPLHDTRGENDYFWDATSSFLNDTFPVKDYDVTWKSGGSTDIFSVTKSCIPDFTFEGPHLSTRGSEKASDRFNVLDSSTEHLKHQMAEEDFKFLTSDESKFRRNSNLEAQQFFWSDWIAGDAKDSLSFLNGESCLSGTVRDEGIADTPPARDNRRCSKALHGSIENEASRNNYPCRTRDVGAQEGRCEGSGKLMMTSNPSNVEQAYFPQPSFMSNSGHVDCWLFEDGFPSVSMNSHVHSDLGSFYQSYKKDHSSPCCTTWADNQTNRYTVPDLHFNSELSFGRSKHDTSVGCTPLDDPSGPSFCSIQSFNSSFFSKFGCGKNRQDIDFKINVESSGFSEVVGLDEDMELPAPELSGEESVTKAEGDKSKGQTTDHENFKLEKEMCMGKNSIASENRREMVNLNQGSVVQKDKDVIQEVKAYSSGDAEETSVALTMADKSDSCVNEKESQSDTPALSQHKIKDPDFDGSEGSNIASEEQEMSTEPSGRLMMLESHVLQFLYVQKAKRPVHSL